jgi:tetratricopeptide (TPR) repeat protein
VHCPLCLGESASAAKAALDRAAQSAGLYLAQWPGAQQGLRDRSEVLEAQGEFAAAVDLRERILATAPKDPVLRWELAHAQLALGASFAPKSRYKAREWLRKGADTCEALSKEDPANIQYQRDRAVALGTISRIDLNLSQLTGAVASASESVSILEQLTASDRRNASFRLDLRAAHVSLSNAFYQSGQAADALRNATLAVSIQEEEAARNPDNPDFPRQAAANYRNAGNIRSLLKDFQGAVEQYRKAEAVDRKLLARYPTRFEFSEALRADLDSIAATYLAFGDTPSALRAYTDAFEIARSAVSVESTEESLASVAKAHEGLANGLGAMSRWDEAIAEERAAVAIRERQAAAGRDGDSLRRALARSDEALSRLYENRGDYKTAVAASGKARPFLEAAYVRLADDESRTELLNLLSCLRTQYLGNRGLRQRHRGRETDCDDHGGYRHHRAHKVASGIGRSIAAFRAPRGKSGGISQGGQRNGRASHRKAIVIALPQRPGLNLLVCRLRLHGSAAGG